MGDRFASIIARSLFVGTFIYLSHSASAGGQLASASAAEAQEDQIQVDRQGTWVCGEKIEEICEKGIPYFIPPPRIRAESQSTQGSLHYVVDVLSLPSLEWCQTDILSDVSPALAISMLGGRCSNHSLYLEENPEKIEVQEARRGQEEARCKEGPDAPFCSYANESPDIIYSHRSALGQFHTYEATPDAGIGTPYTAYVAPSAETTSRWDCRGRGQRRDQGARDDRAAEAIPCIDRIDGSINAGRSCKDFVQTTGHQGYRDYSLLDLQDQQPQEGSHKSQRKSEVRRRNLGSLCRFDREANQGAEDQLHAQSAGSPGSFARQDIQAEGGPSRIEASSCVGTFGGRRNHRRSFVGRKDARCTYDRVAGRDSGRGGTNYGHRPQEPSNGSIPSQILAYQEAGSGNRRSRQAFQGSEDFRDQMNCQLSGTEVCLDDWNAGHFQLHQQVSNMILRIGIMIASYADNHSLMLQNRKDIDALMTVAPGAISYMRRLAPFFKAAFPMQRELRVFSLFARNTSWNEAITIEKLPLSGFDSLACLTIFMIHSVNGATHVWEILFAWIISFLGAFCFWAGTLVKHHAFDIRLRKCPIRIKNARRNQKIRMPKLSSRLGFCPAFFWLLMSSHVTPCFALVLTQANANPILENASYPQMPSTSLAGTDLTVIPDETSLIDLSGILALLQVKPFQSSQAITPVPEIVQAFEADPVAQETARVEEALQRTWQLFHFPQSAYTCVLRTRRLPTMPPNICRHVHDNSHFELASAVLNQWEDLATREWGLSPTRVFHPVFMSLGTIVILVVEHSEELDDGQVVTVAAEIVVDEPPIGLSSAMFARKIPSLCTPNDLYRLWDIIPCTFSRCEMWMDESPIFEDQMIEAHAGMHLQIYIPRFDMPIQMFRAGVSGPRWLQFWSDHNQPMIRHGNRIDLRYGHSPIAETGQLALFRVPRPFDSQSQIDIDVRTTTVDETLERLILDQWMDLVEEHWSWTCVHSSWHDTRFLDKYVHVLVAYDHRPPLFTILCSVETLPIRPPMRIRAVQCDEWLHIASLVVLSGAARDCLMEDNHCDYYFDGALCNAQARVKATHGSFFRVVVHEPEESYHYICDAASSAEDLNFLMQSHMHMRPQSQTPLTSLARRGWIRATIWMNLRELNDQCHSFPTSTMFRLPATPEKSWEQIALQALSDAIPRTRARQNGKNVGLVWPQPPPLPGSFGLVQIIATDYVLQPMDMPVLMDIHGLGRLDRTIIHFWSHDGGVRGAHIVARRHMTESCLHEGWCFFRFHDQEYQIDEVIILRPFAYLELIFVRTPVMEARSDSCETLTPRSDQSQIDFSTDHSSSISPVEDGIGPEDRSEEDSFFVQLHTSHKCMSQRFGVPSSHDDCLPQQPHCDETPNEPQRELMHAKNWTLTGKDQPLQSMIIHQRLPPPGNGRPRIVSFEPVIEVWDGREVDSSTPRFKMTSLPISLVPHQMTVKIHMF